jgi:hypothetical protein
MCVLKGLSLFITKLQKQMNRIVLGEHIDKGWKTKWCASYSCCTIEGNLHQAPVSFEVLIDMKTCH